MPCDRDVLLGWLADVDACEPALLWVEAQPVDATLATLWETCPEGAWLWWLLTELEPGIELDDRAGEFAMRVGASLDPECPAYIPGEPDDGESPAWRWGRIVRELSTGEVPNRLTVVHFPGYLVRGFVDEHFGGFATIESAFRRAVGEEEAA